MHRYLACKDGASAPTASTSARRVASHCMLLPAESLPTVSAVLTVQRCRSKQPLLLLLFAAALLSTPVGKAQTQPVTGQDGVSSSSATTSVTVVVRTGAQLAAAFANNSVQVALISADVALVDDDWAPYAQPFVELNRDFTLLGTFTEKGRWPSLDFGYTSALSSGSVGVVRSAKVRLMPGVTLTFRHMVVKNGRELPHFQFMGCDLITDSPPPPEGQAWPILLVEEAGMWQRSCLPLSTNGASANSIPRHPQIPGAQSALAAIALSSPEATGCVNSSSVPAMERCWPAGSVYTDLAMYAANADAYNRPFRAGYILWLYNAPYFCDVLMSDECVQTHRGFLGCFYSIWPFSRRTVINGTALPPPWSAPPPPTGSSPGRDAAAAPGSGGTGSISSVLGNTGGTDGSPGGDGGSSESILGPVLGGVLGGVALLLGAIAFGTLVIVRRRRNRHAGALDKQDNHDFPQQRATGSVTSSCALDMANTSRPHMVDGSSNVTRDENARDSDAAAAVAAIRMLTASELALVPVTPLTPLLPGIPLDVKMGQGGGEVMLLPVVLGKGTYGRVVEGLYGGVRVAVKLLNRGLMADIFGEGVAVAVAPAPAQRRGKEVEPCSLQEPCRAGDQLCVAAPHLPHQQVVAALGGPQAPQPQTAAAATLAAAGVDEAGAAGPLLLAAPQHPGVTPLLLLPAYKSSPPLGRPQAAPGLQSSSGPQLPHTTPAIPTPADLLRDPPEPDILLQLQQQLNCTSQQLAAAAARPLNREAALWDSSGCSSLRSTATVWLTAAHAFAAAAAGGSAGSGAPAAAPASRDAAVEGSWALEPKAVLSGVPCQGRTELRFKMAPWESVEVAGKVQQAPSLRSLMRRTLAQEVEVLARMQHPNIIRLLAANLSPHSPCLVMERMDTSLDRVLYRGRPNAAEAGLMPLNKVLHIALHVARALAYLHPTIIHRDLKPGNVLISDPDSPTPIVKLADFGLSRLQDTVLVTARVDVGTAPYMAPEALNIQNFTITHHSDMYSFGIMMWEMLAGERPWKGLNMVQIAYVILERSQRPLFDAIGEDRCPRTLRALIHQCWDPVPERRPGASEVVKMIMLIMEKARVSVCGSSAHASAQQTLGKFEWPVA